MKKITSNMLKALLIATLAITTIFTAIPKTSFASSKTYSVTASSLNVRTGPSTKYKVLFSIKKNTKVTKVSTSGKWYKIKHGKKTGFVSAKYLKVVKKPVVVSYVSVPKKKTYFYVTEKTGLTMRKGAGVSYSRSGMTVPFEAKVQILKQHKNGWIQAKYKSKTGWINASKSYGFSSTTNLNYTVVKNTKKSYIILKGNSLNIRKLPNVIAPSIGKVGKGYSAQILRTASNGWVEIQYSNKERGWLSSNTKLSVVSNKINTVSDDVEGTLVGLTFVVDAGHGATDGGAPGKDLNGNKVNEKTLNLKASQAIQTAIQNAGGKVLMTRDGDTFLDLKDRANFAKGKKANAFISVHHNSAGTAAAAGFESFYSNKTNSKEFAEAVHDGVIESVKEEYPTVKDRQLKAVDYYVVRYNSVFATLLELGFLSNKAEVSRVNTNKYRTAVADGVVNGLLKYYDRD